MQLQINNKQYDNYQFLVSIHAPVKGATAENAKKLGVQYVSIHAPVKGAT